MLDCYSKSRMAIFFYIHFVNTRKKYIWIFLFAFVLMLSQMNWIYTFSSNIQFLYFPGWLWFMLLLHIIFVVLLFIFLKGDEA